MSKASEKYDIRAVLEGLGYAIPEPSVYAHIGLWRAWYQGHVTKFHDYSQFNGRKKIKRRRRSLRMAKQVCSDHANLLLNEKVQLQLSSKAAQEKIDAVLQANNFRVKANKLIELAFALGTGAFVEHDDGQGGVIMDYVRADMIFPLSWDGEDIDECAFGSVRTIGGQGLLYLNLHTIEDGEYVIRNKLIPLDSDGRPKPADGPVIKRRKPPQEIAPGEDGLLPDGLLPELRTGSMTPRFQIFGPNQVNNIDIGSPLGASIYANSLDLLEGVDLVYDSYYGEFRLGKKRIIIPMNMLQLMQDNDETWMAFDDNDTEFYGLKDDNLQEIKEINMELRVDAHDKGLQRFVNLLSAKCGLGNDRYKFDGVGLKTATEVVSEKSELFQALKKNELVLEAALRNMCKAIAEICGITESFDVVVNFDDSIIEDTEAKRARMQVLVSQGSFPLWRYLMEYEGYSQKDAKAIAKEVEEAQPSGIQLPPEGPDDLGDEGV